MTDKAAEARQPNQDKMVCGIVRPIAAMDDYTSAHWEDVHEIICEAASDSGFISKLVSENAAGGVILSDIVTNLYNNSIVVADVSGRNPNVMFELGMRMAFEKPVVIIIDDDTPFSFDISPVKHLQYPRTLRFADINKFKKELSAAISGSVEAFGKKGYRGYLQQFGNIEVSKLEAQHLDVQSMANSLVEMQRSVSRLSNVIAHTQNIRDVETFSPSKNALGASEWVKVGVTQTQSRAIRFLIDGNLTEAERGDISKMQFVSEVTYEKIDMVRNLLRVYASSFSKTNNVMANVVSYLQKNGHSFLLDGLG